MLALSLKDCMKEKKKKISGQNEGVFFFQKPAVTLYICNG